MNMTAVEEQEILALRRQGCTLATIAELKKRHIRTVRRICTEAIDKTDPGGLPNFYEVNGRWMCEGQGRCASGKTKEHAYSRWGVALKQGDAAQARQAAKKAKAEAKARAVREEMADSHRRIALPRQAFSVGQLSMPEFMQRQHARAAAVQPPMQSMASTVHGVWVVD